MQKFNIYTSEESFRQALSSDTIFQLRMQCIQKLRSFQFFPYKLPLNRNVNVLCTALIRMTQPDKLWYNFPVVTRLILENELFLSKRSIFRNCYCMCATCLGVCVCNVAGNVKQSFSAELQYRVLFEDQFSSFTVNFGSFWQG